MKKLADLIPDTKRSNSNPITGRTHGDSSDGIKHGEIGSLKLSSSKEITTQEKTASMVEIQKANAALTLLKPFLTVRIGENEAWVMPWREPFELSELNAMEIVAQTALEGSPDGTVAQVIDVVWETLGYSPLSLAAATAYIEAISDIPDDLIWVAMKRLIKTYVYPTPPKPAHFREMVEDEMRERRLVLHRVKTMNANQSYLTRLRRNL